MTFLVNVNGQSWKRHVNQIKKLATDEQPTEFNTEENIDSGSFDTTSSQDIENQSTPHSQSSSDPLTTSSAPRYP